MGEKLDLNPTVESEEGFAEKVREKVDAEAKALETHLNKRAERKPLPAIVLAAASLFSVLTGCTVEQVHNVQRGIAQANRNAANQSIYSQEFQQNTVTHTVSITPRGVGHSSHH